MKLIPRDYQAAAVDSIFDYFTNNQKGNPVVALPTGCHAKGHLIMMFDGSFKAVENIEIGDQLMGPDSLPRTVLALAHGRQEMREIIPTKGESFVVNLDHKLSVKKVKESECKKSKNEVITIRDYENGSKWYKHVRKLRRVGVNFKQKQLSLDPYYLGLMLGDGSLKYGTLRYSGGENIILNYIKNYLESKNLVVKIINKEGKHYDLIGVDPKANKSNPNRITNEFRNLNIGNFCSKTAKIPFDYKTGSKKQRLEILAGLLDSDGHLDLKCNGYEHTTISKQLADDVKFIARSLGLAAYTKESNAKLYGKVISKKYRTLISGEVNIIPVKIQYKKAKPRKQIKDVLCTGFKINKLPKNDYYGFTLDRDHLYLDENFIVHHNTGKSIVIADFLHRVFSQYPDQKIIMATHVKELIKQNHNKLTTMWPEAPVGVHSAGLKSYDIHDNIIFGGIGSMVNRVGQFGKVDLMVVDEAHLVSPKKTTMYQKFIEGLKNKNPYLRIIGLTATPWRLGHGHICENGSIFTDLCFDLTNLEGFNWFIDQGYLAPLIPKQTDTILDVSSVGMRGGEFVEKQLQEAVNQEKITYEALQETLAHGKDRRSWLVFTTGIEHAVNVTTMLNQMGISAKCVHSGNKNHKMTTKERDANISSFLKGEVRALVNSNVLTTGFDHPAIDLIVMLRPTASAPLWVQMLGRGTRPLYELGYDLSTQQGRLDAMAASHKQNCMVLDFGGNTHRLGAINDPVIPKKKGKSKGQPAPVKTCEKCSTINHASVRHCISCGHEFHFQSKLKTFAGTKDIIKKVDDAQPKVESFVVNHITYKIHKKKGKPDSLRVNYFCGLKTYSEFIMFEHDKIKNKFKGWWRLRSGHPFPQTTELAFRLSQHLKTPTKIKVWVNKKYPEILGYDFDH